MASKHPLLALSFEQHTEVLYLAAEYLAATVQQREPQLSDEVVASLRHFHVPGCFVTARQDGSLRGCCGFLGKPTSLPHALRHAAHRTACHDHRFSPITSAELPELDLHVWLLDEPRRVAAQGEARREAVVIGRHGVKVRSGERHGLLLPSVAIEHRFDAETLLQHVCRKAKLPTSAWKRDDVELFVFEGLEIDGGIPSDVIAKSSEAPEDIRPAAVAGTFYPEEPRGLHRLIDDLLQGLAVVRRPYSAVMVPHAGLKYSGKLAADVFRRVQIPETVIVLGPKHTRRGATWAVAPHDFWEIPGARIANDTQLVRALVRGIPDLQSDNAAHAQEHAIEVELPFLAHLSPQSKVVGIAIGGSSFEDCRYFAEGLAKVVQACETPPLLVISSDMNHFANDAETRRLDELALACIDRLDAEGLLRTCRQHRISMCGVLPAVIVMETLRILGKLNRAERIGHTTSGEVNGQRDRVVGYAGVVFE
jgi:AmmeMemoRadiSam system protein B/AmmeMemoRadiSam system protein A